MWGIRRRNTFIYFVPKSKKKWKNWGIRSETSTILLGGKPKKMAITFSPVAVCNLTEILKIIIATK